VDGASAGGIGDLPLAVDVAGELRRAPKGEALDFLVVVAFVATTMGTSGVFDASLLGPVPSICCRIFRYISSGSSSSSAEDSFSMMADLPAILAARRPRGAWGASSSDEL